jgi:hypothetical protein
MRYAHHVYSYWDFGYFRKREESHYHLIKSTWHAVARARRRKGDLAGADRATRQARMTRPLRLLLPPRKITPSILHLATDIPGRGGVACGGWVIRGDNITKDIELVDCGNCTRTKIYRSSRA